MNLAFQGQISSTADTSEDKVLCLQNNPISRQAAFRVKRNQKEKTTLTIPSSANVRNMHNRQRHAYKASWFFDHSMLALPSIEMQGSVVSLYQMGAQNKPWLGCVHQWTIDH